MAKILLFSQGVSGAYLWPLLNETGTVPATIPSDYTVKSQIRASDDSTSALLAELHGSIVSSDSVMVSWTDAESRAWTWNNGYMDVILRDATGVGVKVVWRGKATLSKAVTAP